MKIQSVELSCTHSTLKKGALSAHRRGELPQSTCLGGRRDQFSALSLVPLSIMASLFIKLAFFCQPDSPYHFPNTNPPTPVFINHQKELLGRNIREK